MPGVGPILVAGMVAGDPGQGGASWAVLQYVLGLRRLGIDVVLVDPLPPGPIDPSVAVYFEAVVQRFGLRGRAAMVTADGCVHGMAAADLDDVRRRAEVLLNLSGRWRDAAAVAAIPVRVFVDLDPGFTQLWHGMGIDLGIGDHTHHVTVGAGVAAGTSTVPAIAGVTWLPMLPPVALYEWRPLPSSPDPRLTAIANWRSYGSIDHDGRHFGQKAHSFRRLAGLPTATSVPVTVALAIADGDALDRCRLEAAGWDLVDPVVAVGDPDRYRRFVRSSWAELGVAKSGYVEGATGWVSDRTACYLAAGRPAIVQDTGLGAALPTGGGLVTFDDVDGAVAAIDAVAARYDDHRRAARRIAEEHLDARSVLASLLAQLAS